MCVYCWCIKDIIYEKMHGMDSFKVVVSSLIIHYYHYCHLMDVGVVVSVDVCLQHPVLVCWQ
jgi:hypothetical protein